MIARLHGEVIEKGAASVIVDVGGVGYEVVLSLRDLENIKHEEPVTLYTFFHVRENSQELFGFLEFQTKQLFELLLSVSGVGPKMAISILGLGEQRQIRQAVAAGNVAYITGATGVGKRLAERVVVDLKDKVGVLQGKATEDFDLSSISSGDDAIDALMSLGYSRSQVVQALSKLDPELGVEERVKAALKEF